MSVLEREYGLRVELDDGLHTEVMRRTMELTRQQGGNPYDAASMFMSAMTIAAEAIPVPHPALLRAPQVAIRNMPFMKRPELLERQWVYALSGGKERG